MSNTAYEKKDSMYSIEELIKQVKAMGVKEDDLLTVHSSLRAIGEVENRGEGVITALRTAVKEGLLLVPAHTWRDIWTEGVFDVRRSVPCIGTLPTIAVQLANQAYDEGDSTVRRSLHPSHSVVAFGKRAIEYIQDDERVETAIPEKSSYGNLKTQGGKILLAGVGLNRNTFLHMVHECLATELLPQQNLTVIDYDGRKTARKMCKTYGQHEPFVLYRERLEEAGAIVYGQFGNAPAILCDAKKSFDVALAYEKEQLAL